MTTCAACRVAVLGLALLLASCGGGETTDASAGRAPATGPAAGDVSEPTSASLSTSSSAPEPATPPTGTVAEPPSGGVVPVIVDTDMGGDDVMALLYLLQRSDVDVVAVTVTGTGLAHCPEGGANALAILRAVGADGVPVACGPGVPTAGSNAFPEEWRAGADVLAARLGLVVPGAVDTGAVDLLIRTAHGSARPVRLLAIGPLTNVALAFDRDPAIADHLADIVVMGGAVDVEGTVEPHYRAEWNIWADPAAADRVLRSGVPITLVPLDATNAVPASVFFHEALAEQMSTPEAELVYEFFATHPFNLEGGAYFFWDVLAAAAMVEPDVATYRGHRIAVVETAGVDQGATVESPAGAEVLVAVGADRGRFEAEFLSTLNGEVPAAVSVPEPDLSVRYDEASCALEAPTDMVADGPAATVVVEFANASVGTAAAVFGLHPGVDLEEVVADAARGDELTEPPPYWQETGLVVAFGAPLTGGSVIGRVELEPGVHAVVCVGEDDRPVVAGDVRVEASAS